MSKIFTEMITVGTTTFYRVTSSPDGTLEATLGSVAIRTDTPQVWVNDDGATSWTQITSGGGGSDLLPAVVVNAAVDLDAQGSNNICYSVTNATFNQSLPSAASSTYTALRFVLYENGAFSTITFVPNGSDTIVGNNQLQSALYDDGIMISDGVDTWYWFGRN